MPIETTATVGRVRGDTGLSRLIRRREFVAAAKGRRYHARLMSLQAIARESGPVPGGTALRVGLTVTKKAGHSTERNRIRRRLKAALRDAALAHRGWQADLVVVARREILSAPFDRLRSELADAMAAIVRKTPPVDVSTGDVEPASRPDGHRRRGRGGLRAKPDARSTLPRPDPQNAIPPEPPRS